jgi:CRISPR-associated protein Csh2
MSGHEELPNSEILLLYEARMCNPNGDPDAENRPRIDPKTSINLVSDVRLKRYFRDYIVEKFGEEYIYVTKIGDESLTAESRLEKANIKENTEKQIEDLKIRVLKNFIDARLFGATIPIGKGDKEKGVSASCIGPVQFTWGFSLHKVELLDSPTITSVFSGRAEAGRYGTMGKDWRIYYSLIGFYGVVSGRRAKGTLLKEEDLKVFDNLIWTALEVQPTTRSKIGEAPHLYLRVEYNNADTVLGDMRKYIKVSTRDPVRSFQDLEVNLEALQKHLESNLEKISRVYIRTSDELSLINNLLHEKCGQKLIQLPHKITDDEIRNILKRG